MPKAIVLQDVRPWQGQRMAKLFGAANQPHSFMVKRSLLQQDAQRVVRERLISVGLEFAAPLLRARREV